MASKRMADAIRQFPQGPVGADGELMEAIHNVSDVRRFIETHVSNFEERGTVHDRPRSGPSKKVPHDVLLQCIEEWNKGWTDSKGTKWYYESIEAAVNGPYPNGYLVWVVDQYDVKNLRATLWERMLEADPTLQLRRRPKKHVFTAAQMQLRINFTGEKLAYGILLPVLLMSVVFIDAKKGWTESEGEWVYASKDEAEGEEFIVPKNRWVKKKMVFYVAVNALIGPVKLFFCSGTTGYKTPYKVSMGLS